MKVTSKRVNRPEANESAPAVIKITSRRKKAVGGTKSTTTAHPPFNGRERPLTG
jgi:hypothetical protein